MLLACHLCDKLNWDNCRGGRKLLPTTKTDIAHKYVMYVISLTVKFQESSQVLAFVVNTKCFFFNLLMSPYTYLKDGISESML